MAAVMVVGGAGSAWAWTEHADRVAAQEAAADERADVASDAQAQDADALLAQAVDASRIQSAAVRAGARAELAAAADHARATLAASEGAVADDAVRQALAASLAVVDEALAATDPAATGATATGPTGHSATSLRALAASLAAADAAAVAAHDAWTQAEAAAEAARQAAAAAKPSTGSGSSSAPSCGTTYSGPPFYTSPATPGGDGSNGRLPPEALTAISWDVDPHGTPYFLTNAAASALERLNVAFRAAFGHDLGLDLTYRDYDTQVAMRDALGSVAAKPGTSSHGTGRALDVPELPCEYGWGTPQRDWLVSNGPSYGWVSPSWAGRNGSNPEYWHFEFTG